MVPPACLSAKTETARALEPTPSDAAVRVGTRPRPVPRTDESPGRRSGGNRQPAEAAGGRTGGCARRPTRGIGTARGRRTATRRWRCRNRSAGVPGRRSRSRGPPWSQTARDPPWSPIVAPDPGRGACRLHHGFGLAAVHTGRPRGRAWRPGHRKRWRSWREPGTRAGHPHPSAPDLPRSRRRLMVFAPVVLTGEHR